jgi:hypothetical protein
MKGSLTRFEIQCFDALASDSWDSYYQPQAGKTEIDELDTTKDIRKLLPAHGHSRDGSISQ